MRVFVTGGTGFIGSHLADRLMESEKTEELRCLVRSREKWLEGKNYRKITGDLSDEETLKKALQGVDTLFHVAAIVKAPDMAEFERANVEATVRLIRAAAEIGVSKLVILSSLAAAGPSDGRPLTEEDPMNPVSMYGESKKRMEEKIHEMTPEGLSVTILRPPVVYGPRETQVYTWFRLLRWGISPIVGDGESPRISLIYVSDLVDAMLLAAGDRTPGIRTYFITGPEPVTWNQIRNAGSRVLGRRPFSLYVRPGLVKKLAGAVETLSSFFRVYPVFNCEKANEMVLEWTCSSRKAMDELGYRPRVSLDDGIARTINWYKKHNWL